MAEEARIGGQGEPRQGHVDVPGGRLHYLDWGGGGLPAHFLHGNGFCAGTYAPFLRLLAPDLRVTASDIRGHGESAFERMPPIRHWKVFAEDLALLVTRALGGPVVGMGHSLGAVATTMAAAVHPELFPALVLVDPVFFEPLRLWRVAALRMLGLRGHSPLAVQARRRRRVFKGKAELMRVFAARPGAFKSWAPEFIDAYLECGFLERDAQTAVLRCDPELEAQIFESVPVDVWGYIKRLRCPVLALRGSQSEVFTEGAALRLKRLVPTCTLVTLPGCGHFPAMEQPGECARVIKSYLRETLVKAG
ncbi:MAG TPA: alpha/beta hydrolase [Desulfobacterales bacterium]|nr:alpha/beta hydrolase [Desulfobacterales bacterium]